MNALGGLAEASNGNAIAHETTPLARRHLLSAPATTTL
jgi:hypothetical protein